MIKLLVLSQFLAGISWNCFITRKNKVRIKKKISIILLLVVFGLFALYLASKFDDSLSGYCISISAIVFVYTFIFNPGISYEAVNVFLGTTPLIKQIKFDEIENISYKDINEDSFEIQIDAFGRTYSQIYSIEDKDKVLELIKNIR